jgi:hypothetical protein
LLEFGWKNVGTPAILGRNLNAPICLQIPSKVRLTLGKIIPVALKYILFTMQNSPLGHPTGVIFRYM